MDWYKLEAREVVQQLGANIETGLSAAEVARRRDEFGPNEIEEADKKSPWVILLRQFTELMVIILLVAAVVSVVLGEYTDAVVILAIIVINAAIGFSQEYRAEQAMEALKKLSVPNVRVRRDGQVMEVASPEIVPGDIVLLEAGNVVPADGRLLESFNIKAQESALTGESEPISKSTEALAGSDLTLGDRVNMLYSGTIVTYGRGVFVVTETGMNTELGKIAGLIQGVEEEQTPLQKRLAHLGKVLTVGAIAIIAVVVALGWVRGEELKTLFLTGIGMAVAAVPESLPAVVTITLALGAQRLLKRNALIRQLPAVETLGSVTVICSDKTGTLTENQMTVTMLDVAGDTWDMKTLSDRKGLLLEAGLATDMPGDLNALSVLVRAGVLCNDAILQTDSLGVERAIGDPTEGALLFAAEELGFDVEQLNADWRRVYEIPFTSERKRMTTVHAMGDEIRQSDLPWRHMPYVAASKGAVDSLLDICNRVLVNNEFEPLDDEVRQRIEESNARLAAEGQRVLGVSFGLLDSPELPEDDRELEKNQIFVGLVAMMDPPRPEVFGAIRTAKEAGIHTIMITGDHPLTAQRIAQDLGISADGRYLTGRELATMTVADLEQVVEEVSVYARVEPEQKLNIVDALHNKGEIPAMTGDGVNDAPALKRADIGVAMGITGTDVSKEASDMILLDDNFATIVAAVEEGRVIYDNIRKFIKYTLSSNIGELFVMLVGPLLGMPLPLLPLQILWVNLVTDGLPGLALALEPGEADVMKRPPYNPRASIFSGGLGWQIIWIGALMGLVSLAVGFGAWLYDPEGPWQTMVFTTLVLAQMGNALATRSQTESVFSIGLFSNRLMDGAIAVTFVLQLLLIYWGPLQNVFSTEALSTQELIVCLVASSVVFIVVEISKWIHRRRAGS